MGNADTALDLRLLAEMFPSCPPVPGFPLGRQTFSIPNQHGTAPETAEKLMSNKGREGKRKEMRVTNQCRITCYEALK